MLRIHYMQQWFGLSDPAMEEALHDVPLYREFAGLGDGVSRLPDETTILRFRHLLETHDLAVDMLRVVNDILQAKGLMLRTGTAVDATLIAAPSSTKNAEGERDPEMHQTKKGNQWYFGMKAHIGVDAASGLVHTVVGTAANVSDVNVAGSAAARRGARGLRRRGLPGRAQARRGRRADLACGDAPGQAQAAQPVHRAGVRGRACREDEGQHPSQGRAPVPGDQAAVRVHEGALPRAGEEHGADRHAVRAVEPVDGAAAVDRRSRDECVCEARIGLARPRERLRRAANRCRACSIESSGCVGITLFIQPSIADRVLQTIPRDSTCIA